MIQVENLTKQYGNKLAVDHISFEIEDGRIYGFLGPNGAGKSTTMNIITGCISATSGRVLINGKDILKDPIGAKKHIGYLPELPPVYPDMTPWEYLSFVAEAKGVGSEASYLQVKQIMELTALEAVSDRLIGNLSKGYQQRVGIAQALLGDPDIIILDEPTVGLDPKQIIEIRDLIRELGKTKTVILSSHILAEISAVCDHIMILSEGKLVANDTPLGLESRMNLNNALTVTAKCDEETGRGILSAIFGVESFDTTPAPEEGYTQFTVFAEAEADLRESVFLAFAEAKIPLIRLSLEHMTLEEIFLSLTAPATVPEEDFYPLTDEPAEESTESEANDTKETEENEQ